MPRSSSSMLGMACSLRLDVTAISYRFSGSVTLRSSLIKWISWIIRKRRYRQIEAVYREFAARIGLTDVTCVPMSALKGDNILVASARTPWHRGATLMGWLETVEVDEERLQKLPFRFPVHWVNRPSMDFRGYSGTIASGVVKTGDRIRIQPSGRESRVARIVTDA